MSQLFPSGPSMPREGDTRRGADAPDKALRGMCQMMRAVPHENIGRGDRGIDKFFDRHVGISRKMAVGRRIDRDSDALPGQLVSIQHMRYPAADMKLDIFIREPVLYFHEPGLAGGNDQIPVGEVGDGNGIPLRFRKRVGGRDERSPGLSVDRYGKKTLRIVWFRDDADL